MSLPRELKEIRDRFGYSLEKCARAINCSIEGYRLKEKGERPVSGTELARLADLYATPLSEAFPSYRPTLGEVALARHLEGFPRAA